jgi:hypothetical protein
MAPIKTTTRISFFVGSPGGGRYSPNSYSKYTDRWIADQRGELAKDESIYGFDQAIEHANEILLRKPNEQLCIISEVTVITSVPLAF